MNLNTEIHGDLRDMLSVSAFFLIQSVPFDGIKRGVFDRAKFGKTTLGDFPRYGLFLPRNRKGGVARCFQFSREGGVEKS